MQIYIGRIPRDCIADDLYRHFSRYGKIKDLRMFDSYGFVTFKYDSDARRVLDERQFIFGEELLVEPARDSLNKQSYSIDRYERGFERGYRSPPAYNRSPCDYCDRCERHGTRQFRSEYRRRDEKRIKLPENINNSAKLVIDNIPLNTIKQDLIDFAIANGFQPVYTRITNSGNHGILEFRSIKERDEALFKFNSTEFMGQRITARPYFHRESDDRFGGYERKYSSRANESNKPPCNPIEQYNKEEDIYGDININCDEKKEEEVELNDNSEFK